MVGPCFAVPQWSQFEKKKTNLKAYENDVVWCKTFYLVWEPYSQLTFNKDTGPRCSLNLLVPVPPANIILKAE